MLVALRSGQLILPLGAHEAELLLRAQYPIHASRSVAQGAVEGVGGRGDASGPDDDLRMAVFGGDFLDALDLGARNATDDKDDQNLVLHAGLLGLEAERTDPKNSVNGRLRKRCSYLSRDPIARVIFSRSGISDTFSSNMSDTICCTSGT